MGLKILIVDDEPELLEFYEACLELAGHEVVGAARDGAEAVALFGELAERPGLILMDHRMPGMTGLEAARAIRELAPTVPILFATADHAIEKEVLGLGHAGFSRKPFRLAQLVEAVASFQVADGGGADD